MSGLGRRLNIFTAGVFILFSYLIVADLPASAQSATLNGSVARTGLPSGSTPLLIPQTPQYDYSYSYIEYPETVPRNSAARRGRATARATTRTTVNQAPDNRTYFQRHPKVKAAVVGAGVGAGAGAVTGLISRRGIFRGAAIGAGTGAGVGLIRSSNTMKRHPMINDTVTGAAIGFGLSAAASRRGSTMAKSSAVGAAVGLGYSLLKKVR